MKLRFLLLTIFSFLLFNCSSDDKNKQEIQKEKPAISFKIEEKKLLLEEQDNLLYDLNIRGQIDLDNLQWSSSNSSVLEVNKGLIKAKGLGEVIITVWIKNTLETAKLKVVVNTFKVSFTSDVVDVDMKDVSKVDYSKYLALENITMKELVWSIDNEDIATVDQNGMVTLLKDGIATIHIRRKGKEEIIAISAIRVKGNSIIELYIVPKDMGIVSEIIVNQKYQFKATIYPLDVDSSGLVWSSSNPSIATVDQTGVVHGVSVGEVIITITAPNGVSNSLKVKIVLNEITSIYISTPLSQLVNGQKTELYVGRSPVDADLSMIEFTSSNPKIATVDSKGIITTQRGKMGTVIISAHSKKNASIKSTITIEVVSDFYRVYGGVSFIANRQGNIYDGKCKYGVYVSVIDDNFELSNFKVYSKDGTLLFEDSKTISFTTAYYNINHIYEFNLNKADSPYVTYQLRNKESTELRREEFRY